jgi:quercetin dioxygenase-like cupin family protein
VIRVKVYGGVKLMPHKHSEDRYTVISGVFYIGLGDQFDPEKLEAYLPGAVIVLPSGTWHFHRPSPASSAGDCRWTSRP